MLADYPLHEALDEGAPAGAVSYLEVLLAVLEDGVIGVDEGATLADTASAFELAADDVQAAHRGFVIALAHKAVEDGRVTREERDELKTIARLLDLSDAVVTDSISAARELAAAAAGVGLAPLPADWTHGEPLRLGDRVAFTGCDDAQRARLEAEAATRGVRVTGAVSRKTTMLISDGSFDGTKASAAREYQTRVVHPDHFEKLLLFLQPALPTQR
jgi:DNA polymerase-3 subunit epsilon